MKRVIRHSLILSFLTCGLAFAALATLSDRGLPLERASHAAIGPASDDGGWKPSAR